MMRFNEAIDRALGEAVGFFSSHVDRSRNLLLGMLGHDMCSPLQTIQLTALHLAKLNDGGDVSAAAARLVRSGARMQALPDDMLDFSRTRLGLGIRVTPTPVVVATLVEDELDQLRFAHEVQALEPGGQGRHPGHFATGAGFSRCLATLSETRSGTGSQRPP